MCKHVHVRIADATRFFRNLFQSRILEYREHALGFASTIAHERFYLLRRIVHFIVGITVVPSNPGIDRVPQSQNVCPCRKTSGADDEQYPRTWWPTYCARRNPSRLATERHPRVLLKEQPLPLHNQPRRSSRKLKGKRTEF
jgi:hypothetical protein